MKHTFELAWNYYWIFTTFFSNFVVIYWKAKEEKKREKLWRNRRTFWRIYCNLIDDEISYLNLHEELLSRVYQNFRASINSTIGSNDKKKKGIDNRRFSKSFYQEVWIISVWWTRKIRGGNRENIGEIYAFNSGEKYSSLFFFEKRDRKVLILKNFPRRSSQSTYPGEKIFSFVRKAQIFRK